MKNEKTISGFQPAPPHSYTLPNGLSVWHLHKHETDFTYREIFQDQIYLRNGIELPAEPVVFDVGANIGLFMLFIKQQRVNARVYAFEPSPQVCQILRLNAERFGSSVQVCQCGLSDTEKDAVFTYYPNYSILSSFHADHEQDAKRLAAGIGNQLELRSGLDRADKDRILEYLIDEKLGTAMQFACHLQTVSGAMRKAGVEHIDLLKVDAEGSEIQIFNGVEEGDWHKIHQVAMEVHGHEQADALGALLRAKGFAITLMHEDCLAESDITNLYARR